MPSQLGPGRLSSLGLVPGALAGSSSLARPRPRPGVRAQCPREGPGRMAQSRPPAPARASANEG
eukprot:3413423-Alexandrium_andersonii.AAC.1